MIAHNEMYPLAQRACLSIKVSWNEDKYSRFRLGGRLSPLQTGELDSASKITKLARI